MRALDNALKERDRYRAALESIASLPQRFGHFSGHDAATEAVRIAKAALAEDKPGPRDFPVPSFPCKSIGQEEPK